MPALPESINPTSPAWTVAPPDMPVPDRLNTWLAGLVFVAPLTLLWLGSNVTGWAVLALGIAFSYLLLTNYALLHEATHGNLRSTSRANYWLEVVTGLLFPIPFTMVRNTHQGHHQHNRTDGELFDLYYPQDNLIIKYVRWYGILCGFFWPLVPLGALVSALFTGPLTKTFRHDGANEYFFGKNRAATVRAVRLELLLIIAFFAALFWLLDLRWQNTLVLYACFSVNWSTRQYVSHAFSKRDIVEGAWNIKHISPMSWLLLHGEYDLNHHRHPEISWFYLSRLCKPEDDRPIYWRQYWKQWLGPRPNLEPEHKPADP